MSPQARMALLLPLTAALWPAAAAACSVCYGGGEESRTAFIVTTVFLSALPLAMIGGLVWWIWRRVRAAEAASGRDAEPAVAGRAAPGRIG